MRLSEEGSHFSALGMMTVTTVCFLPSALKEVVCFIVKIGVATFALTLGQIPYIKSRTWSSLEGLSLVSATAFTTVGTLALHVYKCAMFFSFSPLCCLLIGLVSPQTCKDAHAWMGLTPELSATEKRSDELEQLFATPLVKNHEKEEEKRGEVVDTEKAQVKPDVLPNRPPRPLPIPKGEPWRGGKKGEGIANPANPEMSKQLGLTGQESLKAPPPPPPPPPALSTPPPATSQRTPKGGKPVDLLSAIQGFKKEQLVAVSTEEPEEEKGNDLTEVIDKNPAFQNVVKKEKERPVSAAFSNWEEELEAAPEAKDKAASEAVASGSHAADQPDDEKSLKDEAANGAVASGDVNDEKKVIVSEKPSRRVAFQESEKDSVPENEKVFAQESADDEEAVGLDLQAALFKRRRSVVDTVRVKEVDKKLASVNQRQINNRRQRQPISKDPSFFEEPVKKTDAKEPGQKTDA